MIFNLLIKILQNLQKSFLKVPINFIIIINIIIIISIINVGNLFSQTDTAKVKTQIINNINNSTDTSKTDSGKYHFVMKKSPMGAVWRSLVLPGWGQIYTESYWKAPLFIGATGVLVYFIWDNHNKFVDKSYEVKSMKRISPDNPNLEILINQRETYRDNRDRNGLLLLGVYVLSAVDAYVDAHLFDFDVSDKVNISFFPTMSEHPGIGFQVRFK